MPSDTPGDVEGSGSASLPRIGGGGRGTISRSQTGWTYVYVAMAICLGFTWSFIQVVDVCWKPAWMLVATAAEIYLFMFNRWFVTPLSKFRAWYEGNF